jgi:hypothetical protein
MVPYQHALQPGWVIVTSVGWIGWVLLAGGGGGGIREEVTPELIPIVKLRGTAKIIEKK